MSTGFLCPYENEIYTQDLKSKKINHGINDREC